MDKGGILRISVLGTPPLTLDHSTFFILDTQINKGSWKEVRPGQEGK